jgi:cellulose synthase/poly-beta-1,6-N-acetylglucosamine synthase-like glycosyltransferase
MISKYRVYEYTLGMEIARRFQAIAGVIPIIPGPTSCFRSDVFEKLNFADNMLTEDFDVTLQIHRQKLGTIQFIPEAVAYTQDPQTFKDFMHQINRWNRGVMQGIYKHGIGRKAGKIDAYLSYQIMQNLMFFVLNFIWLPFLSITLQNPAILGMGFLSDVILTFGMVMFAAGQTGRWDILKVFPFIYGLRWVNLLVFIRAFAEVSILGKFRNDKGVWEGAKRAQLT